MVQVTEGGRQMASTTGLTRGTVWGLIAGAVLLLSGFGNGSWLAGLAGVGILFFVGRIVYTRNLAHKKLLEPWPWPADLRSRAEGMARPIDPTPERLVPPHENAALVAQVATTKEALTRLRTDKPAAWPVALFASVLVQRRNAVQARLRRVASGYQPPAGAMPLSGQAYSQIAHQAVKSIVGLIEQIEQFMLSPAFTGAFGEVGGTGSADPEAIIANADRLMDYHEALLVQAQTCLQTPVDNDVLTFVQDAGAVALVPLLGYEEFITTMCARIGEAQELLPYGDGNTVMQLDDVTLKIAMPEDLSERFFAQIKRFNATP
jgi:hypothetical protein